MIVVEALRLARVASKSSLLILLDLSAVVDSRGLMDSVLDL